MTRGPVADGALDLTVVTGDANAQANELRWYLPGMAGHCAPTRVIRAGGRVWPTARLTTNGFWHPETEVFDLPRRRFGFPRVPGLLAAANRQSGLAYYRYEPVRVTMLVLDTVNDLSD